MLIFNNDGYTIQSGGCAESWLYTIRALLAAMARQDDRDPLSSDHIACICNLIDDMLPDVDTVDNWEGNTKTTK